MIEHPTVTPDNYLSNTMMLNEGAYRTLQTFSPESPGKRKWADLIILVLFSHLFVAESMIKTKVTNRGEIQ